MKERSGGRTPAWALVGVAAVANLAGYVFNLYQRFWWWDEAMHAFTPFALTLLLAVLLYGKVLAGAGEHGVLLVLAITALGTALAGVWEIAEWTYDQMVVANAIKGKLDTIVDLILGLVGSAAAGGVAGAVIDRTRTVTVERRGAGGRRTAATGAFTPGPQP